MYISYPGFLAAVVAELAGKGVGRSMALHRPSQPARQGSKNENDKEEEDTENNGYIQIFVKPLEQGNYGFFLSWFGLSNTNFSSHQLGALYGVGVLLTSAVFYQLLRCDVGLLFQRLCGLVVPMFSILCAFYWLSLYFRRTWSTTSVYLLFSSCYLGETLAQVFLRDWGASHPSDLTPQAGVTINSVTQPLVIVFVLLAISIASVFSSLETIHSAVVILLVSFTRFLACSALADLPQGIRPYVAYTCGFAGILVAKYMETVLKPPIQNFMTQDGKIPVIKRRRSSSSSAHAFSAHRSARRTSLPALIQKSQVRNYVILYYTMLLLINRVFPGWYKCAIQCPVYQGRRLEPGVDAFHQEPCSRPSKFKVGVRAYIDYACEFSEHKINF